MYNKMSQSILDYLMLVVKDFPSLQGLLQKKTIDPAAKKLYSLWSDDTNKISSRKIRIPSDMADTDLNSLERSGLIQIHGKDLKITAKGEKALREMILSDDSFALSKKASSSVDNWYTRMTNEDLTS